MPVIGSIALAVSALLAGFRDPPHEARSQVWWHWMNGNVSREGIVADLDAMREVGLGGVTLFDAGRGRRSSPSRVFRLRADSARDLIR